MTVVVDVTVLCEHPSCPARVTWSKDRPASQVGEATLEARSHAQEHGWSIRRRHGGADL